MDLGDRALHEPTSGVTGWRLPKAGQTVNGSKMCGQRTAYGSSLFDTRDLAEITAPDYPGERLVVWLPAGLFATLLIERVVEPATRGPSTARQRSKVFST
jgi:hypothetical protein